MTSRRLTLPGTWRHSARRAVQMALHLRPAPPAAPPRAVAPAIVASVAAVVGLVIATGNAAEARSLAARPTAVAAPEPATTGGTLASPAEIARAVNAVDPLERRTSARASRSSARAPLHRWVRPNYGPLSSPFGYRWGRLHAGIDLAGPYGSPILAATDGCITYAGPEAGYGEVMTITDWDGTETLYGHMSAFVKTSGCVKAGQEIARIGAAGDATGAHLHFEVHVGGVPINPIPFLAKRGVSI
jgi:murein DD-endopeptidase MepM/ murein hydrolase activator NlpD